MNTISIDKKYERFSYKIVILLKKKRSEPMVGELSNQLKRCDLFLPSFSKKQKIWFLVPKNESIFLVCFCVIWLRKKPTNFGNLRRSSSWTWLASSGLFVISIFFSSISPKISIEHSNTLVSSKANCWIFNTSALDPLPCYSNSYLVCCLAYSMSIMLI